MVTHSSALLANFLHYAPNAVVFTQPAYRNLHGKIRFHVPTAVVPDVTGHWGQKTFWKVNSVKAKLILGVLLQGHNVTWADSDTVLMNPRFPANDCDIFASLEHRPMCAGSRDSSCAGFLHFRNTQRARNFAYEWAARTHCDFSINDQCHFQRIATENTLAKVCSLDKRDYANGHMWVPSACRKYGTCLRKADLEKAAMIHANFVVGTNAKIAALKAAGFWHG